MAESSSSSSSSSAFPPASSPVSSSSSSSSAAEAPSTPIITGPVGTLPTQLQACFDCKNPIKRINVDHLIRGESKIQWTMDPNFHDPLPHEFQLQVGRTGNNNAADWKDVGTTIVNGTLAMDDSQRLYGKMLLTHYRIVLTTPVKVYVSQPTSVRGNLSTRDWAIARDVLRKEGLRHKYVSHEGAVLQRMRFGTVCKKCRHSLTNEVADTDCPECQGTGFEVGYHTPIPLQMWDLDAEPITEDRDANKMRGNTRDDRISARILGCIQIKKHDVFVDDANDQRWIVHQVKHKAEIRGVPLVVQVELRLAPFTHPVYAVEMGGEPASLPGPVLPTLGTGSIRVDHDFGGPDNLAYQRAVATSSGTEIVGVLGAVVQAFATDELGNMTGPVLLQTTIRSNGRWTEAFLLDPGDYVIRFEKVSSFGPDFESITVGPVAAPAPTPTPAPVSSSSSSSSVSSSSSFGM